MRKPWKIATSRDIKQMRQYVHVQNPGLHGFHLNLHVILFDFFKESFPVRNVGHSSFLNLSKVTPTAG